MRTQIIQLDRHDDILSARDKITWGKTARVLLVWPKKGMVLSRRLDLVLLQRYSRSLGIQLALVSSNRPVIENAQLLGIPVYKSVDKAQAENWHTSPVSYRFDRIHEAISPEELRARQPSRSPSLAGFSGRRSFRLVLFSISILSVLGLGIFFFPYAQVRLDPVVETQELRLALSASPQKQTPSLSGQLPLRSTSVIVAGQDSLLTTGKTLVPDTRAAGIIRFSNQTDQVVKIPAGTIVLALRKIPVRLETTRDGVVEAGIGKIAEIPAQAVDPGEANNLYRGEVSAIEGPLGLSLNATNPDPISGGKSSISPAPNADDRKTLKERLEQTLQKSAMKKLLEELPPDSQVAPSSLEITEILEETAQPAEDQPSNRLDLTLRLAFTASYVSGSEIRAIAASSLDANLPSGYKPTGQEPFIELVEPPALHNGSDMHWMVMVRRQVVADPPDQRVIDLVAGKTPADAIAGLRTAFELQHEPGIRIFPQWWPWLPYLSLRISVLR